MVPVRSELWNAFIQQDKPGNSVVNFQGSGKVRDLCSTFEAISQPTILGSFFRQKKENNSQ